MNYILLGLAVLLVLFLYCACNVSSNCSRLEELEAKNERK